MTIVTGQAEALHKSKPARSGLRRKVWEHRADYAYVLPAIVVMLIVIAYPIYYTVDLSFYMTPPGLQLRDKIFVGVDNYTAILTSDVFWRVTWNTLIWTLASTLIAFVLGFATALALNRYFIGRGLTFAQTEIKVVSSRRWELVSIDHPAVKPLLGYRSLYRIYTANGWAWLREWVSGGRFRPGYLPGGTATGRWVTHGGGALQIPKVLRRAVIADPGWRLVVADASQLEPRILAAISRDPGLMDVAGQDTDLYKSVSDRGFSGDRAQAKLAVLGAIYGQTSGDGLDNLATLRRRFPKAVAYVDDAARAGEEGRLVRTWLGRTCPPATKAAEPIEGSGRYAPGYSSSEARARGRFTRNFVVQGSASDWALLMLASLRQRIAGLEAELVFFQHDEVIVHCPEAEADQVAHAIQAAGDQAGRITFGKTPVRFPFGIAKVHSYADAK